MAILSLRTTAFRNLVDGEINTSAKEIFLVGKNGQGKTNFLEALYFCAYASSFRGVKDNEMARGAVKSSEDDEAITKGVFSASAELGPLDGGSLNSRVSVKVEKSHKVICLDGKKIEDRKDLLEIVPCVAFCHEDMEFVSGSQERRRWFFDQTQSLYDPVYLDDLRRYRRVLKSRNAVLKEAQSAANFSGEDGQTRRRTAELLDSLDLQLAEYGLRLMEKRRAAAENFSSLFYPLYKEVSGAAGPGVVYVPSWKNIPTVKDNNGGVDAEMVIRRLEEKRFAELSQGITLSGPHRDRYLFVKREAPGETGGPGTEFSLTASTGQRRLLALLLRTAQARCFSAVTGKTPVLLLDDALLELDGEKRRRFLSVMPDYEQAFFTFLPEEPYEGYKRSTTLVYYVNNGIIGEKP
jgi:DNA replication and repair protein RecF